MSKVGLRYEELKIFMLFILWVYVCIMLLNTVCRFETTHPTPYPVSQLHPRRSPGGQYS